MRTVYRHRSAQRGREKRKAQIEKGHHAGGRCFGYRNVDVDLGIVDADGRPKRSHVIREIKEEEAQVVRDIYTRYAMGDGYRAIAIDLNRRGVPSPRPQQGRSAGWDMSSIRSVLHRAVYRGEVIDGKEAKRDADGRRAGIPRPASDWLRLPAEHLRIVSPALASRVDARLALNQPHKRGTGAAGRPAVANRYLLTGGLCVCYCGAPFEVVRGRQYSCSRRRRKGTCNNARAYKITETDEFVLEALLNEALDEEMVDRLLDFSPQEDAAAGVRKERDVIAKRILNLEAAIENADEVSMVPALVKRLEATHGDLRAVDQALVQAGAPKPPLHEMREAMLRRVNDGRNVLMERHVAGCRDVLQRMVGRFELIDPSSLPDYVRALMPDPERFSVNPAFSGLISPHAFDLDTYVWRPRGDLFKTGDRYLSAFHR